MEFDVLDTLLAPLDAAFMTRDARIIHTPGFARIESPSDPRSSRNEVFHSVLAGDADRVIDETLARYADLGTAFKWSVGPGSAPADLVDRLLQRGAEQWQVLALGCATRGWDFPLPDDVAVEAVTPATLPEFVQLNAAGWGERNTDLERLLADMAHSMAIGQHRCFLARIDGQAVGLATWTPRTRGPAYLSGGLVLPAWRGRGVYRALIAARFADMAALGNDRAITLSRAHTSGPILERLGMTPLFRYPIFELPAP